MGQPTVMVMMVGSPNKPFESRPDILNMVGRPKDILTVITDHMTVTKKFSNTLVHWCGISVDHTVPSNMFQEKTIGGALLAVVSSAKDYSFSGTFINS